MNIKGIQKTSLVDFPGKLSSVIFLGGCNLNCRFCYNPDLITNDQSDVYSAEYTLRFLKERSKLIDSVVITGGEPTLSPSLEFFLKELKKIPLFVKIDTNGTNPHIINRLLSEGLVDYAAVDVKTSSSKYKSLAGTGADFNIIKDTILLLKDSGIDYELRTTCVPEFVTLSDFEDIKKETGRVKRYYLQQFNNRKTLDPSVQKYKPYPVAVLNEFAAFVNSFADVCEIRGI